MIILTGNWWTQCSSNNLHGILALILWVMKIRKEKRETNKKNTKAYYKEKEDK